MKYKLLDGLVLEEVCGEHLIIATLPAVGKCPFVNTLNESAFNYVNMIQEGLDTEEMLALTAKKYDVDVETIRPGFEAFLKQFIKAGYILTED